MLYSPEISIVIPLYNEEESIAELCSWIRNVMDENHLSYELILVDDGSQDDTWEVIQEVARENPHVKGIRFNRNYGKSAALNTGFRHSKGEVVITMDGDLQDSPDEIPDLYRMVREGGYDLVSGWKKKRYDPISKTIPSKLFNYITRLFSGIPLHDFNCGLKAYRGKVARMIEVYGEMHRYIPVIVYRSGFTRIGEKAVQHRPRKYGKTKFGIERFIFGFLDLLSISFVSKFRKRPMHFFGTFGTLSFLMGLFITIWLIADKFYSIAHRLPVREVVDQPLFFLALVALIVGMQLFLTGFVAELLALNTDNKSEYIIVEEVQYPEKNQV
jgi:glycosyltransferase involved in cell wall biosynthesis